MVVSSASGSLYRETLQEVLPFLFVYAFHCLPGHATTTIRAREVAAMYRRFASFSRRGQKRHPVRGHSGGATRQFRILYSTQFDSAALVTCLHNWILNFVAFVAGYNSGCIDISRLSHHRGKLYQT